MLDWSTGEVAPRHRFDAWADMLNQSHLPWALARAASPDFDAAISSAQVDGLSIVNCRCDPCAGVRRAPQIASADDGLYGVLVIRRGRERLAQQDIDLEIGPGAAVIWDAAQGCSFEVVEPLDKTTLFFTKDWLHRMTGMPGLPTGLVDTSRGFGALFRSRVMALDGMLPEFDAGQLSQLFQSLAMDVVQASSAGAQVVPPRSALLARIDAIVAAGLTDPDFGPVEIARRAGISRRYLHALFQERGETVGARLLRLRLDAVARDLRRPGLARASVTQIGFANGFASSAHLSRSFRARFGVTPSGWRHGDGDDQG
ncbi:helix-turn-helix domain-containing protein [Chachezhania antarctica]|uniref:helix-turn-helix domain-containing protein n=1 Tax=Chachezhania antarctica TaxID=2340860 RepID=UPI000EB271D5|nr:helix-turn-helix domain-containing protein [Chachezhania antarctica]